MQQPGRSFNSTSYRYGFNGQEKDKEIDANGNIYTAQYWEYDSRIGRRWNIEPLIANYPWLSGYATLGNNPINASDPNGEDVIFVNGYIRPFQRTAGEDASNRDKKFQTELKEDYWNSTNKNFTNNLEKYFNDHAEHFVNGSHTRGSAAADRIKEGKNIGIKMVRDKEISISANNHIMTIVMHSQGNAEGVGIAEGILEEAKREGLTNVTVNLVFLSVHQPYDIPLTPELQKRGIQFTYANDDSWTVRIMAKQPGGEKGLVGVLDANSKNKKNKGKDKKDDGGGVEAHGATVDKPEAVNDIIQLDKTKHIYVIKP